MRFSIIIPAKNEERMIGVCLQHIEALDFAVADFEVILVDNGSTDRTQEIFDSWSDRLNVSTVTKPGVNIGALRNAGAAISRGVLLGFLDADCVVPCNWLREAEALLSAPTSGIVGAHVRIPPDSSWIARSWFDDEHANRAGETSYVPSGDLLVRRSTFDFVGGFDELLKTNEDYEFCQRARRAGFSVRTYPELEVVHLGVPRSIPEFYRKQAWHGQHVVRVFLHNLPNLYNVRVVFFAFYMFVGLLMVLCGSVAVMMTTSPRLLEVAVFFCLCGPIFLSLRVAIRRRKPWVFPPLILLYLLYGIARASCILQSLSGWNLTRHQAPGRVLNTHDGPKLRGSRSTWR